MRRKTIIDKKNKRTFELQQLLGDGTTAKVYEVKEIESGKIFACKIVPQTYESTVLFRAYQEIDILKDLKHDHIIQLEGWFEGKNNIYLLMEMCVHQSLIELVEKRIRISEVEARCYLRQILLGCEYLHQSNIIHHDLKLNNIFLDQSMQVKIGDFGLATRDVGDFMDLVGTPNYLAPEVLDEKRRTTKLDVWAIGVILYFMLVGEAPFEMDSFEETYAKIKRVDYTIPDYVSENARSLIASILKFDPEERPTATEILQMPFLQQGAQLKCLPTFCLERPPALYEVEEILQSRLSYEGELEYLIKWKRYGHSYNSWELASGCDCPREIDLFEQRREAGVISKAMKPRKLRSSVALVKESRKRRIYVRSQEHFKNRTYADFSKFVPV